MIQPGYASAYRPELGVGVGLFDGSGSGQLVSKPRKVRFGSMVSGASSFTLKAISPAQARNFIEIMQACWRGTIPATSSAFQETAETLAPNISPPNHAVIAYLNDLAVGCGRYVVVPSQAVTVKETWIEIKRVGILSAHRGKALGRTIYQALECRAKTHGFTGAQLAVRTDQPRLIDYWKNAGFSVADDVTLTGSNPNEPPPVCMRKGFR